MVLFYAAAFVIWAAIYFVTWRWDATCFVGVDSFQSAVLFSIETMFTIGWVMGVGAGGWWVVGVVGGGGGVLGLKLEASRYMLQEKAYQTQLNPTAKPHPATAPTPSATAGCPPCWWARTASRRC